MAKKPFVASTDTEEVPSNTLYRRRKSKPAAILKWLKSGHSVNATGSGGSALLHWLASEGNLAGVELLLEHGVNVDPENRSGMTPLLLALNNNQPEVAARLLDHGANALHRSADGRTALHCVMRTHIAVTRRLLEAGVDPMETDKFGMSAIDRLTLQGEPSGDSAKLLAMMRERAGGRGSGSKRAAKKALRPKPPKPTAKKMPAWKAVCREVWKTQVPARGQASTVQGELLRAVEKLRDEALRNGNINWRADHRRLHRFIGKTLRASGLLTDAQETQLTRDLKTIGDAKRPPTKDTPYNNICRLVARFCKAHPAPIPREPDAKLKI